MRAAGQFRKLYKSLHYCEYVGSLFQSQHLECFLRSHEIVGVCVISVNMRCLYKPHGSGSSRVECPCHIEIRLHLLPDPPASQISSLESDCQAQHRLWETNCRLQQHIADRSDRTTAEECVGVSAPPMCVCVCACLHVCIWSMLCLSYLIQTEMWRAPPVRPELRLSWSRPGGCWSFFLSLSTLWICDQSWRGFCNVLLRWKYAPTSWNFFKGMKNF